MKKPIQNIAVVSLSAGIIGEDFVKHEVGIGLRRLMDYGCDVRFMPHALKGTEYVRNHPEDRAADLLEAFRDPGIDMILCAIGGDDTYRLLPYLFENDELRRAITEGNAENAGAAGKVFLGFSDTTVNHFMLHKAGLRTFYGQSFLSDICELDREMLPYTRRYFEELLVTGTIREITPSGIWYEDRTDFSEEAVGTPRVSHPNGGFELLQGAAVFSGRILGGCLDTLHDFFDGTRYQDMPALCRKYSLFPGPDDWRGRILLLETSEEKMPPEKYRAALEYLKKTGIFRVISGVLAGKPMDEAYDREYKEILQDVIDDPVLPVLCNLSIGHAAPRCIIPFGVLAHVDAEKQVITFDD